MKDREYVTTNGRAVFFAAMWNDLRQSAMDNGWALALHGSLVNDMDIMAMPWTNNATTQLEMIDALKKCFTDNHLINVIITKMPNNRVVYTLSIWSDFYLDINIIEPTTINKKEKQLAAYWLDKASDVFSNRGCNDVEEKVWDGWTKEERQQFVKEYHEYNGDPKEYNPEFLDLPDYALIGFLAYKLLKD